MRKNKALVLIILLTIFFRFYRLWDFQYWSVDEEIFTAVVRQIAVNHKLLLVSPNVAIATSLGSFFHLLSAPIFLLANFTASKILIAGSVLGILTTLAIYKIGGKIVAFLYAGSFLVAFSDRRWWPLSLDPLLAILSIFSVLKIIEGKYKYALLLTVSASFAWHADPSLMVIIVFAAVSMVVFKIPLFKKAYILALVYLFFSIAPFFIFELRHPGAVTHPFLELLTQSRGQVERSLDLLELLRGFARALFLTPGPDIEKYFLYTKTYSAPFLSPLPEILTLFFFIFPLWIKEQKIKVVYLFLVSFLFGIVVFTLGMGAEFHQHYFVVAWPAFFILVAFTLQKISRIWRAIFLTAFLTINLATLLFSTMRYPLFKKEIAVDKTIAMIDNKAFALKVQNDGRYFEGIGGLFFLKNKFPSNFDYYEAWDWIYRAYSLYEIQPVKGAFQNIIVVSP